MLQYATPATNGFSSPFTAAMVASSRRGNPSSVRPPPIRSRPCCSSPQALRSASPNRVPISTACPANLMADSTSPACSAVMLFDRAWYPWAKPSGSPSKRRSPRAAHAEAIENFRLLTYSRLSSKVILAARALFPSARYALNARSLASTARSGCAVNQAAWASASRSVAPSLPSRSARTRRSNASRHRCPSQGVTPSCEVGGAVKLFGLHRAELFHPWSET